MSAIILALAISAECPKPVKHRHHHKPIPIQTCAAQPVLPAVFAQAPLPDPEPISVVTRYQDVPLLAPPVQADTPYFTRAPAWWGDDFTMDFGGYGGGMLVTYAAPKTVPSVITNNYISYSSNTTNNSFTYNTTVSTDITNVTYNKNVVVIKPPRSAVRAPELDASSGFAALTLLLGGLAVLNGRRK